MMKPSNLLMMHHPLSLPYHGKAPQPSDHPETPSLKKTPIFTRIRGLRESPNSDALGRKARPFLTLPTLVSHSLFIIECKRQGVYFGVENNVSTFYFANFHTKLSQNTHLFSCHLSQCSYKHTTIN
jgi:hypothetical protein